VLGFQWFFLLFFFFFFLLPLFFFFLSVKLSDFINSVLRQISQMNGG